MVGDTVSDGPLTPVHLTKQEFGRRLFRLLLDKGWKQADLARHAGVTRDAVSTYVRGVSLPEPLNLQKIASALGVAPHDLLPNHTEAAIEAEHPAMNLRVSSSDPTVAWLQVNRLVTTATAVQIIGLLESDATPASD